MVDVGETVSESGDAGQEEPPDLATVDKQWRVRGRGYWRPPGLQARGTGRNGGPSEEGCLGRRKVVTYV